MFSKGSIGNTLFFSIKKIRFVLTKPDYFILLIFDEAYKHYMVKTLDVLLHSIWAFKCLYKLSNFYFKQRGEYCKDYLAFLFET